MFDLADIWARRTGSDVRLVSANDHVHTHGSAHYAGLALDLISSNPDGLAATFRQIGYQVLWRVPGHRGHVHVQEPPLDSRPTTKAPIATAATRAPTATATTKAPTATE